MAKARLFGALAVALTLCGVAEPAGAQGEKKKEQEDAELPADVVAQLAPRTWLVLVNERSPWAGLDHPTFVLYADGILIYLERDEPRRRFLSVKLSGDEIKELMDKMDSLQQATKANRSSLLICDAPETWIWVRKTMFWPSSMRVFWGTLRTAASFPQHSSLTDPELRTLEFLRSYAHPQAAPWIPEQVEVWLMPAKAGATGWRVWSPSLPKLNDAFKLEDAEAYRLYLDRAQYLEMESAAAKSKPGTPWLIDGKMWDASVRFLFPHQVAVLPRPSQER